MEANYNTWKLITGKIEGDFQIPFDEAKVERIVKHVNEKGIENEENVGFRKIKYVPGSKSIWAEDFKGDDSKPKKIWFRDGILIVPKADKVLNEILTVHPWNGVYYKLFDKEEESKKELEKLRFKDEVNTLITDSSKEERKAICVALLGVVAITYDDSTCELQLRKYAENHPEKLKTQLKSKDYESKYLAALAFAKDIVKTTPDKSAVLWSNNEGRIISIAKGENHITAFSEYLSKRTDESVTVLQTIGERVKQSEMQLEDESTDKDQLDAKDREIAALKAQLAAKTNVDLSPEEEEEKLTVARAKYEDYNGKPVANAYKNNLEWIEEKNREFEKSK